MLRIPVVSLLAVTLAGLGLVPTAAAQEASPQGTSILESARAKAATQEAQPIPRARLRSGVRTSLGLMLAGAGVAWLSTPVANSGPMFGGPMPQGSPGATMPVATITPATGTPNTGAPSGPTTAAVALQPARGGGLQLGGPQLGGQNPGRSWAAKSAALGMIGVGALFATLWSDVPVVEDITIAPTRGGAHIGTSIGF